MCMACEEMSLFYAYLDAVEEAKRQAQPWECEVTLYPQVDDAQANGIPQAPPSSPEPAPKRAPAKRSRKKAPAARPGFACDAAE